MLKVTSFAPARRGEVHKGKHYTLTFDQLVASIQKKAATEIKGTRAEVKARAKKFTACHCDQGTRRASMNPRANIIVVDFDCHQGNTVAIDDAFGRCECERLLYTTASHTDEIPRFRILFPTAEVIHGRDAWRRMTLHFLSRYFDDLLEADIIDKASLSIVHLWTLPCNRAIVMRGDGARYFPVVPPEEPIGTKDLSELLLSPEGQATAERYAIATIKGVLSDLGGTSKGHRNQALNGAGYSLGKLIAHGLLSKEEALSIIVTTPLFVQLAQEDGLRSTEATMLSGLEAGIRKGR